MSIIVSRLGNIASEHIHSLLFVLGAALGSALGLVVGALLTFWLGQQTVRLVQRTLRRITGEDEQPSFELLLQ